MKRTYTYLVLILLIVAPVILPAATFWEDFKAPITQLLGLVMTVFGVPLLVRLTRKAGFEITEAQAQAALDSLVNILVNIDNSSPPDVTSAQKKEMARLTAMNSLAPEVRNILIKRYGDMDAAVQAAFEKSSLNKGGK
jgi:hypothetical protein